MTSTWRIKLIINLILFWSLWQSCQAIFYFIYTTYKFYYAQKCPRNFQVFIMFHNYTFYYTLQPLQAIFILAVVNFFTP